MFISTNTWTKLESPGRRHVDILMKSSVRQNPVCIGGFLCSNSPQITLVGIGPTEPSIMRSRSTQRLCVCPFSPFGTPYVIVICCNDSLVMVKLTITIPMWWQWWLGLRFDCCLRVLRLKHLNAKQTIKLLKSLSGKVSIMNVAPHFAHSFTSCGRISSKLLLTCSLAWWLSSTWVSSSNSRTISWRWIPSEWDHSRKPGDVLLSSSLTSQESLSGQSSSQPSRMCQWWVEWPTPATTHSGACLPLMVQSCCPWKLDFSLGRDSECTLSVTCYLGLAAMLDMQFRRCFPIYTWLKTVDTVEACCVSNEKNVSESNWHMGPWRIAKGSITISKKHVFLRQANTFI